MTLREYDHLYPGPVDLPEGHSGYEVSGGMADSFHLACVRCGPVHGFIRSWYTAELGDIADAADQHEREHHGGNDDRPHLIELELSDDQLVALRWAIEVAHDEYDWTTSVHDENRTERSHLAALYNVSEQLRDITDDICSVDR